MLSINKGNTVRGLDYGEMPVLKIPIRLVNQQRFSDMASDWLAAASQSKAWFENPCQLT